MPVTKSDFGKVKNGQTVTAYTLTNASGASVTLLDLGCTIQSVIVPDKDGKMTDVTLGFDSAAPYEGCSAFFGALVGRNANRIAGACFTLNGETYTLYKNDGDNNLHSCPDPYSWRIWDAEVLEALNGVRFTLDSPDMDQGYPGRLLAEATFLWNNENTLTMHIEAQSNRDTVCNMCNHSYWNLNGEGNGTVYDHLLCVDAEGYTPIKAGIPQSIDPVEGTPFDFRVAKTVGRDINEDNDQLRAGGGYDHSFDLSGEGLRDIAYLEGDISGISLTMTTDQPALQIYSGNFVDNDGKGGRHYGPRSGIALETQHHPNEINTPAFEGSVLRAGSRYDTTTLFTFGVAGKEG